MGGSRDALFVTNFSNGLATLWLFSQVHSLNSLSRVRATTTRRVGGATEQWASGRGLQERQRLEAMAETSPEQKGETLAGPLNSGAGRATDDEVAKIEALLEGSAVGRHNATPDQVRRVKSCLREEFLVGLVEPSTNHFWPAHPAAGNWRYLFRRQCFRQLGVYERIPEGHPDGLPKVVNEFIRAKWWPSAKPDEGAGCGTRGPVQVTPGGRDHAR